MKVTIEQEVNLPDEEVFRTILEDYYESERLDKNGWCVFSTFDNFIKSRYKQAIKNQKLGKGR